MASVLATLLGMSAERNPPLRNVHNGEVDGVGEVALQDGTVDVLEGGVVAEFQLGSQREEMTPYTDLFGVLEALGIARLVEQTVLREGAQVLHLPLSFVNMNVSGLDGIVGSHVM